MSLESTSKFNMPGITPTWNASTWSSRWGHEVWMTFLDCPGHLWPEIASWPLHKKSFWLQGGVQNFKIMTWTQDLPQLRWFVPYMNKSKWSNCHNLHCNTRVKKLKPSADLLKFPKCIFMLWTSPFANAFCQLPKTRSGYFSQYWPTDIFSQSINGIFLFTTCWLVQPITQHPPKWLIVSLLAGW